MKKLLITSGCSFSTMVPDPYFTWPAFLQESLPEYEPEHYGMGSQGNGLISRSIIYAVHEALKTRNPEDILVGVMWSGIGRQEVYKEKEIDLDHLRDKKHFEGWIDNPTGFIRNNPKRWIIMNAGWQKLPESKIYYDHFYDPIGCQIQTIENILRLQWFLKLHKVKYFFTNFTDYVLDKSLITHEDVIHLYEQIDFENYLPVSSEYAWLVEQKIEPILEKYLDHPNRDQHREFNNKVIIPWLQEKNYI